MLCDFYNHSAALCERRNARPFATEPISVAEINHHEQGLDSQVLNNTFGLIRDPLIHSSIIKLPDIPPFPPRIDMWTRRKDNVN